MTLPEAQARAERLFGELMLVGADRPYSASDLCGLDDAGAVAFIGAVAGESLLEPLRSPVYRTEPGADPVKLHPGPASLLRRSAAGALAFAIQADDRPRLVVMDAQGAVSAEVEVPGRIEHLEWSPKGDRVMLLVAGAATDSITAAGAFRQPPASAGPSAPSWTPTVDDGAPEPEGWRRPFIHRLGEAGAVAVAGARAMTWACAWCGETAIALLQSEQAGEAAWYTAQLSLLDLSTGRQRRLHRPSDQLDHLAGAPDGRSLAFVEAVASDRGLVCGVLKLADLDSGAVAVLETAQVEIASVAWRDRTRLHLSGQRGLETVVGDYDVASAAFTEIWSSTDWGCGGHMPCSRPVGQAAAVVAVERFARGPRIAVVRPGSWEVVQDLSGDDDATGARCEPVRWRAPDSEEIQGLLIRPSDAERPSPLVIDIHGGPVWGYRASWRGRQRATSLLVDAGYAVLCPNPRGSFGRGQAFARAVVGDMGGRESWDILSGIDHLAASGTIDPARVGLMGSSYGGYMAAWLPKLRPEIAAAVAISPVADWFSQHWTSNIAFFDSLFLGGSPLHAAARYLDRSPALRPEPTRAATLILAGVLDRCTPIGQAIELHRSLIEAGSTSVLVSYPEEGHGVRGPRGYVDSAGRILDWFERFMPA